MRPMIDYARYYAKIGWYVIPLHTPIDGGCSCEEWRRENYENDYVCSTPGKHPRHNDWEGVASNDVNQINKWWRAWPNANIGIAAGKSGLICLDNDKYKDGGTAVSYDTITSLTGGGGEHLIFLHPDIDIKLGNSKQGLPQHIDVRGHGGQFVAPPSLHQSGNRYEWEAGYGPHEIDPAPLPDVISKPLLEAAETAVSDCSFGDVGEYPDIEEFSKKMSGLLLAILTDDRSKQDFWIIRSLVRAGMDNDKIHAIYAHSDPTGKYTSKNGQGDKYLAHTIAKARSHIENVVNFIPSTEAP